MDAERTETWVSRNLLEAVRQRAAAEGRNESDVVEEALRRYLAGSHGDERSPKTTDGQSSAGKFADRFIERYPDTFHELSKR